MVGLIMKNVSRLKRPHSLFKTTANIMGIYKWSSLDLPFDHYPCRACRGLGYYYDPDDPPDPVEGYKLVRRLTCKTCQGKKFTLDKEDKKAFKNYCKEVKRQEKLEQLDYKQHCKLIASAFKKLTSEEKEALKTEFDGNSFYFHGKRR